MIICGPQCDGSSGGCGEALLCASVSPPILIVGRIKCIDTCIVLRTVPGPTRTSTVFAVVADTIVIQPWLWRAWAGHWMKPCGFAPGLMLPGWAFPAVRLSSLQRGPPKLYHQLSFCRPLFPDTISGVRALTQMRGADTWDRMSGGRQILRFIASGPHFPTTAVAVPCPLTLPPTPTLGLPPPPLPPSRGER